MYPYLGDTKSLDKIRMQRSEDRHCPWLRRDSNACNALPDGIDNVQAGIVCPHNVYAKYADVFDSRDSVMDRIESLLRLVGAAKAGVLSESDLDIFSITELLVTESELNRQQAVRERKAHERAKMESQADISAAESWDTMGS